jgi:hypothetical protein
MHQMIGLASVASANQRRRQRFASNGNDARISPRLVVYLSRVLESRRA